MQLNNHLAKTEEYFNVAGSIPIVSIISGTVRTLAGAVQTVAGMVLGLIGLLGMLFTPKNYNWEHLAQSGFEQFNHGGLNFFRGIGEYLLGLTIFGSLALFVTQGASPNKFHPIYKYQLSPEEPKQVEEQTELVPRHV